MATNTGGNSGRFVKGDPRINRKGRPKNFDALRQLFQQVGNEPALDNAGVPVVIDGHIVTVTEAIARQLSKAKDLRLLLGFLEIAYGKVPAVTELTGKDGSSLEIITRVVRKNDDAGS